MKKNSSCHSLTLHAIILLNLLNKSWKSAQKLYACPNTYAPYCIFVVFHIICIVSFTCMNLYVPISVWVPACNFFLCAIKQPSMSYHFWPSGACMISVELFLFAVMCLCVYGNYVSQSHCLCLQCCKVKMVNIRSFIVKCAESNWTIPFFSQYLHWGWLLIYVYSYDLKSENECWGKKLFPSHLTHFCQIHHLPQFIPTLNHYLLPSLIPPTPPPHCWPLSSPDGPLTANWRASCPLFIKRFNSQSIRSYLPPP